MKKLLLLVWVLSLFLVQKKAGADDAPPNISTWAENAEAVASQMHGYADIIRAQAEFIRMVAEARLAYAKASLVEAQAAKEWEEVRKLRLIVNRLQLELRRLAQDEYKLRQKIQNIENSARRVKPLILGWASQYAFQGLRYLSMHAIQPNALAEAMALPLEFVPASDFRCQKTPEEAEDFEGSNVGQLLRYMEKGMCTIEPWTVGHFAILSAFQKLGDATKAGIAEIQANLEKLRKGTLDLWKDWGSDKPKPPSNPPPTPTPNPISSAPGIRNHDRCLVAKAGYAQCLADGWNAYACLPADKGFKDCREKAKGTAQICLNAKSGFSDCFEDGYTGQQCLKADSGYKACREDGFAHSKCVPAKSGYRACRDEGFGVDFCLTADKGYADCRADAGTPQFCRPARGTYKYCREQANSAAFCVTVGKGYQACRELGYLDEDCKKADEGYKDCML